MAIFSDIVGTLMQSGLSGSTTSRLKHALGQGGEASGEARSGLSGALSGLTGGSGGIGGMLQGVLKDGSRAVGKNKNLALGGLGALAGALLGGGGRSLKGALGGGAMAILGAMAFKALKKSGQEKPEVPLGLREATDDEQKIELEKDAELILKAMINAAKVDNKIDQQEVQKILGKLDETGASQEARELVLAEMGKPLDLEHFFQEACTRPQLAPQIYAASLLAIEVDTPAEKQYMQQIAERLNLDQRVVAELEKTVGLA